MADECSVKDPEEGAQNSPQIPLSAEQLKAFYRGEGARAIEGFRRLVIDRAVAVSGMIVDIGGSVGIFASELSRITGKRVRLIDTDREAIGLAERRYGVDASYGDALAPVIRGDEELVCLNMVLHHLIGADELATRELQTKALSAWRDQAKFVFVMEYIYDSYFGDSSGRLIYEITRSAMLSWAGRTISRLVPSLKANTFGTGVRFRSLGEWYKVFDEAGYRVVSEAAVQCDSIPIPRRLLLIKEKNKRCFLLQPKEGDHGSAQTVACAYSGRS